MTPALADMIAILNEVLSLNAQEFFQKFVEAMIMVDSSMKS